MAEETQENEQGCPAICKCVCKKFRKIQINRTLLPIKMFYTFYYSGFWLFLPFFPHFLRQHGYSAADLTILIGLVQFVIMVAKPMIGNLADKYQAKKTCLLTCLAFGAVFVSALYFIPNVGQMPGGEGPDSAAGNETSNFTSFSFTASFFKNSTNFTSDSLYANLTGNDVIRPQKFLQILAEDVLDDPEPQMVIPNQHSLVVESTHFGTYQFWLTLTLFVLAQGIGMSPSFTLMDTITLSALKDRPDKFGKQRMWMAFGTIVAVPSIGYITDVVSRGSPNVNYAPSFIAVVIFVFLSALCVLFVESEDDERTTRDDDVIDNGTGGKKGMRHFLPVLKQWRVSLFIFMVFVHGLNFGKSLLLTTPFMKEMQASQLNVSMGLVSSSLGIMVMTFLSGSILKRIGHEMALCLCLFSFAIRSALWSIVPSPWFSSLTETLLGFALGLWMTTMGSYAKRIAPRGTEASAQSFICGTFEGFGAGVGNIVSGLIYHHKGGVFLWRLSSCGTFILATFYLVVLIMKSDREKAAVNVKDAKNIQMNNDVTMTKA